MNDLKLFLDLIRIKKAIAIMLLFWPCLWGLTLGNNFNDNNLKYLIYIAYFFFWFGTHEVSGLYSKRYT